MTSQIAAMYPEGPLPGATTCSPGAHKSADAVGLFRLSSDPVQGKVTYSKSRSATPPLVTQRVCLTVRTLDKKEHKLSVVHDISVSELKNEVAMITAIDADSQRLVSGGEEMSLDLRLSDYCTAKSHVIYLVVKFPGSSCAGPPTENDTEDVEIEPSTLTNGAESSVPERDVHRVVHSLLGSQGNLSDFVSSMAYNQPGTTWNRNRRGHIGAGRMLAQRGRQTQVRRGHAGRAAGHRSNPQRNSVDVSFRGSEWQSMRVWPQSIDFQAGVVDDFLYNSLEDTSADSFHLHYSSGAHRATTSSDQESSAGRDDLLTSLFECNNNGNYELDDSYLSADQTLLAEDGQSDGAICNASTSDGISVGSRRMAHQGLTHGAGGDEGEFECCDLHRISSDELPLGRLTGKRKYAEMCNGLYLTYRSAPRSRSMAPDTSPLQDEHEQLHCDAESFSAPQATPLARAATHVSRGESIVTSPLPALPSPNMLISIGSPPGGAFPDSAGSSSPLPASEIVDSRTTQDVHPATGCSVCHFELAPIRGAEIETASSSSPSGGNSHFWINTGRAASRDLDVCSDGQESSAIEAAQADCDPLAAVDVQGMDSELASLSLHSHARSILTCAQDASSPASVTNASTVVRAVYKTNPEPLNVKPTPDLLPDTGSPCSVWSERNASVPMDTPVKKNQCCVVM